MATPVYFVSIEARDYSFNGHNGGIPRNDRGVAIGLQDRTQTQRVYESASGGSAGALSAIPLEGSNS